LVVFSELTRGCGLGPFFFLLLVRVVRELATVPLFLFFFPFTHRLVFHRFFSSAEGKRVFFSAYSFLSPFSQSGRRGGERESSFFLPPSSLVLEDRPRGLVVIFLLDFDSSGVIRSSFSFFPFH